MSEIAVRDPQKELIETVRGEEFKTQVEMALPENINVDRFVRVMVSALLKTPELADCDKQSLFRALLKSAEDGLLPNGEEAAITSFKNNKTGQREAVYLRMIFGLRKKVAEFGWSLRTRVIYSNDEFSYEYGLNEHLTHRPAPVGTDRGERIGAYAVGSHKDGRKEFTVMDAIAIGKVRAIAKTQAVWDKWPDQMYEKSAGKQLVNDLPLDPADKERIMSVVNAEDFEPGEAANMLYGPSGEEMRVLEQAEVEEVSSQHEGAGGDENQGVVDSTGVIDDAFSSADPEAKMLADEAGEFVPTNGTYSATGPKGPQTLAQLIQHDEGKSYLGMLLKRLDEPQDYVDAVWTFCGVYAPELVAAAGREKP